MPEMRCKDGRGAGIMAKYKAYAMWFVHWQYQIEIPRARRINCFRAIEMVGKSNLRKYLARQSGQQCWGAELMERSGIVKYLTRRNGKK